MAKILDLQTMTVARRSSAAESNASWWECCSTGSFSNCC